MPKQEDSGDILRNISAEGRKDFGKCWDEYFKEFCARGLFAGTDIHPPPPPPPPKKKEFPRKKFIKEFTQITSGQVVAQPLRC